MYTVCLGDCVSSVSAKHGLFWETVWNAPENSELKAFRSDPNVLLPGDQLFIPDIEANPVNCATGSKHSFVKKGVPAKMKIQFLLDDDPIANTIFTMSVDKVFWEEGNSDGDGYIEVEIPPASGECKVTLGPADDRYVFNLELGSVDPINTKEGVMKRLFNLGYGVDVSEANAISAFQECQGLSVTGVIDTATEACVREVFGQ